MSLQNLNHSYSSAPFLERIPKLYKYTCVCVCFFIGPQLEESIAYRIWQLLILQFLEMPFTKTSNTILIIDVNVYLRFWRELDEVLNSYGQNVVKKAIYNAKIVFHIL